MRFRDSLKIALELFLPEKLIQAGERSLPEPKRESSSDASTSAKAGEVGQSGKARLIIEELDNSQFGGPSFGPQTIELMSKALDQTQALFPQPVSVEQLRLIAATILKVAGDGERDPVRLRIAAMSALGQVAGEADKQSSANL
jgi:hypothetical protein